MKIFVSLERFELSPTASEAGTLSIALQGHGGHYFTMFEISNGEYQIEGNSNPFFVLSRNAILVIDSIGIEP